MFADPIDAPVTTPNAGLAIVAAGALLIHMPPGVPLLVSIMLEPTHTVFGPEIVPGFGSAFIINGKLATEVPQVLVTVYEIVVAPAATAVTSPVWSIVAAFMLLLDQMPLLPVVASCNVEPAQTDEEPAVMVPAFGCGIRVTVKLYVLTLLCASVAV